MSNGYWKNNSNYLYSLQMKDLHQHLHRVFRILDIDGNGLVSVQTIEDSAKIHYRGSKTDVAAFTRTLEQSMEGQVRFEQFHTGVLLWLYGNEDMLSPGLTVLPSQQDCDDQRLMNTSMETDSAIGGSASPDTNGKSANLSQCSSLSDGESFECYGEGDEGPAPEFELGAEDYDEDEGSSSSYSPRKGMANGGIGGGGSPTRGGGGGGGGGGNTLLGLQRNAWARSSLRRAQQQSHGDSLSNRRWGSFRHSGKRLGSNALASQLYRSSSFNSSSSGRGSGSGSGVSGGEANCDEMLFPEDPSSLEEGVLDLNHKIQLLQQQVSALADNQTNTDDKYMRAKQDNATLQARVVMLEEQLREVELRSTERLQEEARRNRENLSRLEREKQLELENCHFRLKSLEKECSSAVEEANRLRSQVERLRKEASEALMGQEDARAQLSSLEKQATSMQEAGERDNIRNAKMVEELTLEVERLRAEAQAIGASQNMVAAFRNRSASVSSTTSDREAGRTSHIAELQGEIQTLREENRALREANEELEAQLLTVGLEQGRTLLLGTRSGGVLGEEEKANSLAAELEAMSQDESVVDSTEDQMTIEKLRNTLREQQEVNSDLRSYIDGILLNIVENYPQLLEVKRKD